MQRHLVLRDADDAEPVEEPLPLVAELFDEHVVRCPSPGEGRGENPPPLSNSQSLQGVNYH